MFDALVADAGGTIKGVAPGDTAMDSVERTPGAPVCRREALTASEAGGQNDCRPPGGLASCQADRQALAESAGRKKRAAFLARP